jgi:hypothetical protein
MKADEMGEIRSDHGETSAYKAFIAKFTLDGNTFIKEIPPEIYAKS